MATGWFASFDESPWTRMRDMAASLAERSRRLWSKRREDESAPPAATAGSEAVSAIEVRLHTLEHKVRALDEEVAASFEVVSAITDQHSELVRAVDALLARTRILLRACLLLAVALAALAVLALER